MRPSPHSDRQAGGKWPITSSFQFAVRASTISRTSTSTFRATAGRHHRPVRLGQVLARLRHHLCRGPAPLCRVAVGLCPPVPRADAEAGCRPDRGPVAGHLHRAEDDLRNPRSTVGTVTEIYDYMRLLWARVGVPYSPATGLPIESQTVSQMVDRVMALPEGTRLYLLAPSCAAARANTARNWPSCRSGLPARQGRRQPSTRSPTPRRSTRNQARHRRGGGPHRRARRHRTRWPTASNRAEAGRRHRHRRIRADKPLPRKTAGERQQVRRTKPTSAFFSRNSPARSPASPSEIEPRLFSSTIRSAPARPATAWASQASSTRPGRARRDR
jgi:hypothetical protein